ncbi:MAG: NAD(P)H-hydrate dehydratase [Deltaproteobacteria bacterium]|nr:NAD(P)H-hydrate dehydratase [Deltaproteobacteria bacterium]
MPSMETPLQRQSLVQPLAHLLAWAQPLATARQMAAMDRHASLALGLPARLLMENAAHAAANWVDDLLARPGQPGGPVVVVCGAGNNGGDGYALARLLANRGRAVTVVALGEPKGDALANRQAWGHWGAVVDVVAEEGRAREVLSHGALLVDALFGTGLDRPLEGAAAQLVEAFNQAPAAVKLALDLPSGVHADTGEVLGVAARCSHTLCFQAAKPGVFLHPGAQQAGEVRTADVSIPLNFPQGTPRAWRLTAPFCRALLPPRPPDGHKGTFGHVLTLGGSAGMGGAAWLAALAALRSGAGLVTAGVPKVLQDRFLEWAPEVMTWAPGPLGEWLTGADVASALQAAQGKDAVVLGCGLGRREDTGNFVRELLPALNTPLVVDADALFFLDPPVLAGRSVPAILTPHPGEMARLAGITPEEVNRDRVAWARRYAAEWDAVLVLKGAPTVVAEPGGGVFLNATGDQGLATAGTGDVLAGILGGLLAQGLSPLAAALLGVWLHGLARNLLGWEVDAASFTAKDLLGGVNHAFQTLRAGEA